MDLKNGQLVVDTWIKDHGVRYFNELTNMAQIKQELTYKRHLIKKWILKQNVITIVITIIKN